MHWYIKINGIFLSCLGCFDVQGMKQIHFWSCTVFSKKHSVNYKSHCYIHVTTNIKIITWLGCYLKICRYYTINNSISINVLNICILGCKEGEELSPLFECKGCDYGKFREKASKIVFCQSCPKNQTTFDTRSNSSKDCVRK